MEVLIPTSPDTSKSITKPCPKPSTSLKNLQNNVCGMYFGFSFSPVCKLILVVNPHYIIQLLQDKALKTLLFLSSSRGNRLTHKLISAFFRISNEIGLFSHSFCTFHPQITKTNHRAQQQANQKSSKTKRTAGFVTSNSFLKTTVVLVKL